MIFSLKLGTTVPDSRDLSLFRRRACADKFQAARHAAVLNITKEFN